MCVASFSVLPVCRLMSTDIDPASAQIEKGKAVAVESDVVSLADIKPTTLNKAIEVKVYRKWISKTIPNLIPTKYCCILLDRQGRAIQANIELKDVEKYTALQVNSVYRIVGFGSQNTDRWQQTVTNNYTLLFGKLTQITAISDQRFPEHYFEFVAFNELGKKVDTKDPTLKDCIGYIRSLGKVKEKGDATTNITRRMKVELQNLNGQSVPLTLWNELATDFPMQTYLELQQPVVLAASSCYVKRYAVTGALQLASTPATHVYLNLNVPETAHILAVYNELLGTTPLLEYQPYTEATAESETPANKVDLKTLLAINPETNKGVRFTVEATLARIDTTATWYFNNCGVCGRGLDDKNPHWQCHEHGTQPVPDYRAILEDSTGTITVSCFSPETDKWVISCVDFLNEVEDRSPTRIPDKLRLLENTRRLFTIHFGSKSKKKFPKFVVEKAPVIPPLALPAPPVKNQDEGPSTMTSHAIEDTCASHESTTAPPIKPDALEKLDTAADKRPSNVKRELFGASSPETTEGTTKKPKTD